MNEDKFTGKASIYAKYRPTYPKACIQWLYSEVGFSCNSCIADIGSGTGILTELLLKQGCFVYGVEPNSDMRETSKGFLSGYSNFKSIDAPAESTTLPDSSVDFVTVAQAFHWFDRELFRVECQRILKGQGKVALIWNSKDETNPIIIENDEINQKFCPNFKGFSGGMRGGSLEEFADFFKNGVCQCGTFKHDMLVDEECFIGRNLSASYAPRDNHEAYEPYVASLKQLYKKYSSNERLHMPLITKAFAGQV